MNESVSYFLHGCHQNLLGCASKRAVSMLRMVILSFSLAFVKLLLDTVSSLGTLVQEKHR